MSKNKPGGGGGDRKGEGISGETVSPRMITSQTTVSGLPPMRPNPSSLQPAGHTYIVHSQHEMKNFSKSARPIAPAPPVPVVQNLATRNVQPSQVNISSIISPPIGIGSSDVISLNLVTTAAASNLGAVTHNPLAVPVTLSQASVLQLNPITSTGNPGVVQQGISSTPVPVTMLRGSSNARQQTQPQIQSFTPNFSHLPGSTSSPAVVKTAGGILRHTVPSTLQTPTGINTLSLPLARAPLIQSIKTAAAVRPQLTAVASQVEQSQPQDLSRTNFALHGSITPVTSGSMSPLSMHVTLNRKNTVVNQDTSSLHGRATSVQVQNDAVVNVQHRLSNSDADMHPRLIPSLGRSTRPFSGSAKITHPGLGSAAKVISPQQCVQIKPVNLAVTPPVVVNSLNSAQTTAITTVASSVPIPIAKVPPQRQLTVGCTSLSSASSLQSYAAQSASSLPTASAPLSVSAPNTAIPIFSPSSMSSPLSANVMETGSVRHDQAGISSTQSSCSSILIASDFQSRPPGSIITMATMAPSIQGGTAPLMVSQADNRLSSSQNQQQFDVKPGDSMWLQHYVFQAQTPLVSQPAQVVRPGSNAVTFLPSQAQGPNPSMAALNVASSSANKRFSGTPVLVMDQLRQQQPLHSTYSTATATLSGTSDKSAANLLAKAVSASSIYTTSVGIQSQPPGGTLIGSTNVREGPVTNANSSPRPSILRKRPTEGTGVTVRKPNFSLNQDISCLSPPRIDTHTANICSPKISTKNFSPISENSQSSTDTALSSNDATTPTHNHLDKRRTNGRECLDNGPVSAVPSVNNIPASPAVNHKGSILEASPRKRARKQLLHVSEELKDNMSSSEDELENNSHHHQEDSFKEHQHRKREMKGEYTDEEGVRWVLKKPKPTYVLLQPDLVNNKTRCNHFTRYSDVRAKEEKWPTVNELSNQRGIMQKVNGWKVYFSASQLEELMDVEKDIQEQFAEVQAALAQINTNKINNEETLKIHEMSQANIQRCQLIQTQLTDARAAMIRTLEHKPRIQEIVCKHMSKRPIKKKERT